MLCTFRRCECRTHSIVQTLLYFRTPSGFFKSETSAHETNVSCMLCYIVFSLSVPLQTFVLLLAVQFSGPVLPRAVGVWPAEPPVRRRLQEEDPAPHHRGHSGRLERPETLHADGPQAQGHPSRSHSQVYGQGVYSV